MTMIGVELLGPRSRVVRGIGGLWAMPCGCGCGGMGASRDQPRCAVGGVSVRSPAMGGMGVYF